MFIYFKYLLAVFRSRKLRLTTMRDSPTSGGRQSVKFACGLKATEFDFFTCNVVPQIQFADFSKLYAYRYPFLKNLVTNSDVWDITPCCPLKVSSRFGETFRLRPLERKPNFTSCLRHAVSFLRLLFSSEGEGDVFWKRSLISDGLRGVKCHEIDLGFTGARRTSGQFEGSRLLQWYAMWLL
jgi:hypothetical protein